MKTYAIEIMGQKEPTYVTEADVVKLLKGTDKGGRLILVGRTLINPTAIQRIRRAYDVDANIVEESDPELNALLEGKEVKRLN